MTMLKERPVIDRVKDAIDEMSLDKIARRDLGRLRQEIVNLDLPEEIPGPWSDRIRADRRNRILLIGAVAIGVAVVVFVRPVREGLASLVASAGRALGMGACDEADAEWSSSVPVMASPSMAGEPNDILAQTPASSGLDAIRPGDTSNVGTGNGRSTRRPSAPRARRPRVDDGRHRDAPGVQGSGARRLVEAADRLPQATTAAREAIPGRRPEHADALTNQLKLGAAFSLT